MSRGVREPKDSRTKSQTVKLNGTITKSYLGWCTLVQKSGAEPAVDSAGDDCQCRGATPGSEVASYGYPGGWHFGLTVVRAPAPIAKHGLQYTAPVRCAMCLAPAANRVIRAVTWGKRFRYPTGEASTRPANKPVRRAYKVLAERVCPRGGGRRGFPPPRPSRGYSKPGVAAQAGVVKGKTVMSPKGRPGTREKLAASGHLGHQMARPSLLRAMPPTAKKHSPIPRTPPTGGQQATGKST